jgi:ABC-2 type transport system ATP-binding protein
VSDGPAISIRGLVKRFGDVVAVDGLDLEVRRGECFGLLGPNGAGKTTTIEILEGLQEPTSGEVAVLGLSWARDAQRIRARIGVQLQETVLAGKLSVRETLRLFASFYEAARPTADVLEDVGLVEKASAYVETLSGGQRQRLAVACALVSAPEILFLDEPTTGLDPAARRSLWDVIRAYQSGGGTVVLTTHYMDEAERLCDRIAIVDRGRVAATGTPPELVARVGAADVVEVTTSPPLAAGDFAGVDGIADARADGDGISLAVHGLHVALPALLARMRERGASATRLSTRPATLEDAFLRVTGHRFEEGAREAEAAAR